MQHLNNNVLCAIKPVFSGPDPDLHALLEICIVPLDQMLEIHPVFPLFHMRCSPEEKELFEENKYVSIEYMSECKMKGTPRDKVAHYLKAWFDEMKMDAKKRVIPLAYNYTSDRIMLERWLGDEYLDLFSENHRDVLTTALFLNDRCSVRAEPIPHAKTNFSYLAQLYKVEQLEKQTAASDCLTLALLYKRMLQAGVF